MTLNFCNFNKLFFVNLDACTFCNTVTVNLMDIVIISISVIITLNDIS